MVQLLFLSRRKSADMPSIIRKFTLFLSCLFAFACNLTANDSDVVNCSHAWKIVVLGSSTAFGNGATSYDSAWAGKFTAYLKRKNVQHELYNYGVPGSAFRPAGTKQFVQHYCSVIYSSRCHHYQYAKQ